MHIIYRGNSIGIDELNDSYGMTFLEIADAIEAWLVEAGEFSYLVGQKYVDEHDSGDLVMQVVDVDVALPGSVVVIPVDKTIDRMWHRAGEEVAILVRQHNKEIHEV